MADDLKAIFQAAAGNDPVDSIKHDGRDLKAIFQQAHDAPTPADMAAKDSETYSPLESKGIGALHGITAGLSPRIAGVGSALAGALGIGASQESADQSIGLRPDLAAKPSKVPDYTPTFQEGMNSQLATEQAAKDQNPISYMAGDLVGSIAPTIAGAGALKGAGIASNVAQGATLGAGLGESNYLGSNADPTLTGAAGSAALGAGLGAVGGKLADVLTPTTTGLENSGSRLAQEAMGMNSAKDLTTRYNPMTNTVDRGSDIIKGTGTTGIEQGVLKGGQGKWYDNALNALQSNYQKLTPLFSSAQSKLEQNLPQIMDDVGPITTKTPNVMQSVFDEVPQTSQKNVILRKIQQQYGEYAQKLEAADGNLQQLNQIKQELTTAAQNLKPQIYNNGSASAEADLYKRLGGIVRQHIEDLANAAEDGTGDQIHQINSTIGNLSSMLPSLQKLTRGGIPLDKASLAQKAFGPGEAFAAKGLNAAKDVNTPLGTIVQKVLPQTPKTLIINPWSQEKIQNTNSITNQKNSNPAENVTKTAANLYNATPESLNDVAEKLQKEVGMNYMGQYLKKAVDDNDSDAKNRAIFALLQNPISRKLLTPDEEES